MGLLAADTFNRTNSTTNLGSTDGAGSLDPVAWTQTTGTWGISSSKAYTSASVSSSVATINAGHSDIDVSLDVTEPGGGLYAGLLFRGVDASNYWIVAILGTDAFLLSFLAGSSSFIDSASGLGAGPNTVRVIAVGPNILVYIDGAPVMSATDSYLQTATKVGLWNSNNTTARFDNFSVAPAAIGYDSLLIEAAFGEQPLEDATIAWTDITSDVRSVRIRRGRDGSQDDFQPGTCSLVLKNETGQYDPRTNADILPRVPVRVSVVDSTATRCWMFTGFVNRDNGWDYSYPVPAWSDVTVNASDYLAVLSQTSTLDPAVAVPIHNTARASNTLGPFVRRVITDLFAEPDPVSLGPGFAGDIITALFLTYVTYPQWANAITGSTSTVILDACELGDDGLQFLQKIAQSEGGAVYVGADGALNFDGRHAITEDARLASAQVTLDDTGVSGPSFSINDYRRAPMTPVYNQSVVTPLNAPPQQYVDASSVTAHGPSRFDMSGLLMESSAEARARAEFFVKSNNSPSDSPKSITLKVRRDDDTLDAAVQRELRDNATVKFTAPGMTQETYACTVESIEHSIDMTRKEWDCTLGFSSYERFADFVSDGIFTLNTDVLNTGLLGY